MKKNVLLFLLNCILCYILFLKINQEFCFLFTIPFLAFLQTNDKILKKVNAVFPILLYFINPVISIISLVCYLGFYALESYCKKYHLFLASAIISIILNIIFNDYTFNFLYFLFPVLIFLYLSFIENKNLHYLIFILLTNIFITNIDYYLIMTLTIFGLYLLYTNNEYALLISLVTTAYQFYYNNDYLVIIYPALVYTALYKNYSITAFINISLLFYMIYLKEINYTIVYSIIIVLLLTIKNNSNTRSSEYYPLVLESFNNEIMSFCSFLDNFSPNENNESNNNFSKMTDIITQTYCISCSKKYKCFGDKKLQTYSMFKKLITTDLQKNKYSLEFNDCLYLTDLISKIITLKPLYPINFINKESLELNGLSKALREYSIDLSNRNYSLFSNYDLLNTKLKEAGIAPLIFEPKLLENGIYLKMGYQKKQTHLIKDIYTIATKVFKEDISIKLCNDEGMYLYYTITNKINYKVTYEEASMVKNNFAISGDNTLAKTYDSGFFKAAIADGMGSGLNAFEISKEAISLVEKISNSDILASTSISILNTFYSLNDHYDFYSTLDYLSIDLKTGNGIIYKMGATTTFIVKKHEIIPIYNKNLPFGIDKLITTEDISFEDDDLVIMISDGITEHIDEGKLMTYLEEIKNQKVHQIAYDIIQKVYTENKQQIKDDMSVIALRINNI